MGGPWWGESESQSSVGSVPSWNRAGAHVQRTLAAVSQRLGVVSWWWRWRNVCFPNSRTEYGQEKILGWERVDCQEIKEIRCQSLFDKKLRVGVFISDKGGCLRACAADRRVPLTEQVPSGCWSRIPGFGKAAGGLLKPWLGKAALRMLNGE